MNRKTALRVGCCITPHGLGHAARVCAVLEALTRLVPVHFEIISTAPAWFFNESLSPDCYTLHPIISDVGLVQEDSLRENLEQTLIRLAELYPLPEALLMRAAAVFADCQLVLTDIAPLGIVAARRLGIPSVLLENFTWDWIYRQYVHDWPEFAPHIHYLEQVYSRADYHLQAEPVCQPVDCDLLLPPVARFRRQGRAELRNRLQLQEEELVVLLTMGGIGTGSGSEISLPELTAVEGLSFVLSGQQGTDMVVRDNLRLLPRNSGIYHPDLVAACDAVIGKIGYSTLAEVYWADIPFAYIRRSGFRESAPLAAFIDSNMRSMEITEAQFRENSWLAVMPQLHRLMDTGADQMARKKRADENGALVAASFLAAVLNG